MNEPPFVNVGHWVKVTPRDLQFPNCDTYQPPFEGLVVQTRLTDEAMTGLAIIVWRGTLNGYTLATWPRDIIERIKTT